MAQNRKPPRPNETSDRAGGRENSQQVRDDIDAGRTRDKVDHPDPATAPLGTDAEAGGAPASAQSTRTDRQPATGDAARQDRREHGPVPRKAARPGLIAILVAIVVIAGIGWYFAAL